MNEVGKERIGTEIEDTPVVMALLEAAEVEMVGIGIAGAGRTVALGVHQGEMTENGGGAQVYLFDSYIISNLISML